MHSDCGQLLHVTFCIAKAAEVTHLEFCRSDPRSDPPRDPPSAANTK